MFKKKTTTYIATALVLFGYTACKVPALVERKENKNLPASYGNTQDTTNTGLQNWKAYFTDPQLQLLIDTALKNNQELSITLQEIQVVQNEIMARKGEYLPFVNARAGVGLDKKARYTNLGAMEANTEIKEGKEMPEPLPDFMLGVSASWELDIWKKLHNAQKAAVQKYLSTIEGRNFVITNLVAEIANSYYELLALDNQLAIVQQNIDIQNNALKIVKLQKEAARVTELAVRKFEAEVLKTTNLQYDIRQQIVETENRINFLLGRYPQPIARSSQPLDAVTVPLVQTGIPSQLLANRPDIKQAQLDLAAAKLDILVARARFYPSVGISAGFGYQAFSPSYLYKTPASILYSLTGDLIAPLVNKNAIKAAYNTANAKQVQAVFNYERIVLNAFVEVANQVAKIDNLQKSYDTKSRQVLALTQSVNIAGDLFKSARADYMEVLMTQRDALESKFELIETRKQQLNATVNIYRALGGGWK